MAKEIVNYVHKNISEFKPGDSIYVFKNKNGFQYEYLAEFVELKRGNVKAIIKEVNDDWEKSLIGTEISARKTKCALWGPRHEDEQMNGNRWHWFEKDGFPT